MGVNTKVRYAVDAMVDLALRERDGPVALAGIARRQRVSLSYLEQLFAGLRESGLVRATRGPGGGYTLGREAQAISVADIAAAVEDDATGRTEPASRRGGERMGSLWSRVDAAMRAEMGRVTLDSLADEERARGVHIEVAPARSPFSAKPAPARLPMRVVNSVFALAAGAVAAPA